MGFVDRIPQTTGASGDGFDIFGSGLSEKRVRGSCSDRLPKHEKGYTRVADLPRWLCA